MTRLLIKLFVKNNRDVQNPTVRGKYLKLSGVTGIIVNLILFAIKLTAGILAASVAVIGDGLNNLSDAGSSVISFFGFYLALKPVDKEHPLGHGRFEYITGFIVDLLIILVGFELLTSSVEKIITPTETTVTTLTYILLGVSILIKLWLFFFYKKIATTVDSSAVKASAFDSITDCVATLVVLISAVAQKVFAVQIDGYVGAVVALVILWAGLKASKETVGLLLGAPPEKEFVDAIYRFAVEFDKTYIVGIHDLMIHDYGPGRKFICFHAEVPSTSDIMVAHDVIDNLENAMEEKFSAVVTVHLDPLETNDKHVLEAKTTVLSVVKSVDPDFLIHDFRMTDGGHHVNLIFDLLIPVDSPWKEQDAKNEVVKKLKEAIPNANAVIKAERPFV